jgi:hypothetical protein
MAIDRLLQPSTSGITAITTSTPVLNERPLSDQRPALPYRMSRGIDTVRMAWQEWQNGLNGGPADKDLESHYGSKWRTGASDRKLFRRRKNIVDHVVTESNARGCPPEDIVEELDKLRLEKSMSFTALEALLSTVEAQPEI